MPSGENAGDCSFKFEKGGEYIVYANWRAGTLVTGHCYRSRRITRKDDSELKWLRTRVTLPTPVALQRVDVTCKRCGIENVALELAGPVKASGAYCCPDLFGLDDSEAIAALKERRPFWTGGRYNHEDPSWTDVLGLSKTLEPFRLLLSPSHGSKERCRQSVTLTNCKSLRQAQRGWGLSPFECVEPGSPARMCNENESRRAMPRPVESLESVRRCDWYEPDAPRCKLSEEGRPLPPGSVAFPLLYCAPSYDSLEGENDPPKKYSCEVTTGPSSTEAAKHSKPSQ
jgi:hypothetical protein